MTNSNQEHCPFCRQPVRTSSTEVHRIHWYKNCACGPYYLSELELTMHAEELTASTQMRIASLLCERRLKQLPAPLVVFGKAPTSRPSYAPIVSIQELLAGWPESVPERIDRSLCNLARAFAKPGETVKLKIGDSCDYLLFTNDAQEARFYADSLIQNRCAERISPSSLWELRITSEGWARISQLAGGIERRRNPVFVAMWFGGKETKEVSKMTGRFQNVIQQACGDAGWLAERVDSKEHNNSIIDRILEMIRKAPFVVADLHKNNDGVYYEAGFARGQGVEVIYLVQDGERPHFDISGVNHVRWQDEADLKSKLTNRILGTMGRGPHSSAGHPSER